MSIKDIFVKEFLTNRFGILIPLFHRFIMHNYKLKKQRCPTINKLYTSVQSSIFKFISVKIHYFVNVKLINKSPPNTH